MRGGFGMTYAIFIMVIIAGMLAFSLRSGGVVQQGVLEEHVRIQLGLYLKSAAELTLLYLSGDASRSLNGGSYDLSFDGGKYEVNATITPMTGSHSVPESNGTVRLDLVGTTNLLSDEQPLRMTKRLVVKP